MQDQPASVFTPRDLTVIKWTISVLGILLLLLAGISRSGSLAFGLGMVILCVMTPAFAAGLIARRRKPIPREYKMAAVVFSLACWAFGGACLYLSQKHSSGHPAVSGQVFTGGIILFAVGVVVPLVARFVARISPE